MTQEEFQTTYHEYETTDLIEAKNEYDKIASQLDFKICVVAFPFNDKTRYGLMLSEAAILVSLMDPLIKIAR